MQLSYRGHSYERNASELQAKDVVISGKYRGNRTAIHQFETSGLRHKRAKLTYRGVKF